jgi:hypothetical protein
MEILGIFLDRPKNEKLKEEFERAMENVTRKLAEVVSEGEYNSFKVLISGKGEVFGLGTSRYIVQLAEKMGVSLPKPLTDALNSPTPLGEKFKDLYAGGLVGEMKRYYIEEVVGEKNTRELLDVPNQLVLYVDDHINTGTKANLILNGIQPHLDEQHSEIYFIAPVAGEVANGIKSNPRIIIGSENPNLFTYLKDSTLGWTT